MVLFTDAWFTDDVSFRGSKFHKEANFFGCKFDKNIDFVACEFNDSFNLQFTLKGGEEDAEERQQLKTCSFENASFEKSASFDNRHFMGHAYFDGCKFVNKAPTFYGCILHHETNFPAFKNFKFTGKESIKAYRTLKLSMENVRNRDGEAAFFCA